jgi:16S rRNA (guanine966-N2)-methyltransferase
VAGRNARPRGRGHQVRIIGGDWRGRRLQVVDAEGLRPTPDRVRETLFNWLAPELPGARVLDAFAGAGALGFEAASRGAGRVTLVERDRRVAARLQQQAGRLDTDGRIEVVTADVLRHLQALPPQRFDLVFVDPPYDRPRLREALLETLLEGDHLGPDARVFVEWPGRGPLPLQAAFERGDLIWIKRKQAGEVAFGLARRRASG